jgi:hypothetical protein
MDCLKQILRSAKRSKYLSQVPEFPEFKGKNKITPPIGFLFSFKFTEYKFLSQFIFEVYITNMRFKFLLM